MSVENDDQKKISTPYDPTENFLHRPGTLARFVQVARDLKLTAPEVEERMRKLRMRFLEGYEP